MLSSTINTNSPLSSPIKESTFLPLIINSILDFAPAFPAITSRPSGDV